MQHPVCRALSIRAIFLISSHPVFLLLASTAAYADDAQPALVKDIGDYTTNSSSPSRLMILNGRCLFAATSPGIGNELWVTDGTADETRLLRDINPGKAGSNPYPLGVFGDRLFFAALHPDTGTELWATDGTPNGTYLVKDTVPGPAGGAPFIAAPLDGNLIFGARQGSTSELWKTDGTFEGTEMIAPVQFSNFALSPYQMVRSGQFV